MTEKEFEKRLDEVFAFGYTDPTFIHDIHVLIGGEELVEAAKQSLRQLFLGVLAAEMKHDDHCNLNTADLAYRNPGYFSCDCSFEGVKIRLAQLRSIINGNARKEEDRERN